MDAGVYLDRVDQSQRDISYGIPFGYRQTEIYIERNRNMEKILKAAVLGMGNMGRGHARSLMRMDNVELAALCSNPVDDARQFAEDNYPDCPVYDDFDRMLDEVSIDVLYICLPPFAHDGQFEKAAEKGIHIFIEKPIALTVARGKAMTEIAGKKGIVTQVGYQMRFGSAVKKFKEYIDSGRAGRPTLYMADYECNSLHGPWWRDVKRCGGQVFEQVIHLYDMGLYLMGRASSVNGHIANLCHTQVEDYTVEDTSVCSIRFESGALGSVCGSNCSVKNQWNARFRVICENMTADFTDQNHAVFTFTDKEAAETVEVTEDTDCTYEEDRYFIGAVLGKHKAAAEVREGYEGLRLVSAVVESSGQDGKTVKIHS